jgi:hypothetical protein
MNRDCEEPARRTWARAPERPDIPAEQARCDAARPVRPPRAAPEPVDATRCHPSTSSAAPEVGREPAPGHPGARDGGRATAAVASAPRVVRPTVSARLASALGRR